jgi:hypothetical protein
MLCDWKGPIDSGDFIVIVVDRAQIDNQEVEMQATYASLTGKTVLAMIEAPGKPADYMFELKGFMWENFDPDQKESFDNNLAKLILRQKQYKKDRDRSSKIGFICFSGVIDCDKLMTDGIDGLRSNKEGS